MNDLDLLKNKYGVDWWNEWDIGNRTIGQYNTYLSLPKKPLSKLMPYADRLYITHIFQSFDADTFFPNIDADIWDKKQMIRGHEIGEYNYSFAIYEKREG